MALGLPEILILLALPLLGKERIKSFFAHIKAFFSRVTQIDSDIPKWRLYTGWTLVLLGCAAPFFIPAVLASPLSAAQKAALSAVMALGLPEILILLALPLLGNEWIKSFFAHIKAFFSRERWIRRR